MVPDEDGLPMTGITGRYLGARRDGPVKDFEEINEDGTVDPGKGGMSVNPPPPTNIAPPRRLPQYGKDENGEIGYGKDPVFELETDELPDELLYQPDQNPEQTGKHGFIEPSHRMAFEEYLQAVHETRTLWHRM